MAKLIKLNKISKKAYIENIVSRNNIANNDNIIKVIMQIQQMRIQPQNSKPKINLGRILGKSSLRENLVRPIYKFTKSVTENNSKV